MSAPVRPWLVATSRRKQASVAIRRASAVARSPLPIATSTSAPCPGRMPPLPLRSGGNGRGLIGPHSPWPKSPPRRQDHHAHEEVVDLALCDSRLLYNAGACPPPPILRAVGPHQRRPCPLFAQRAASSGKEASQGQTDVQVWMPAPQPATADLLRALRLMHVKRVVVSVPRYMLAAIQTSGARGQLCVLCPARPRGLCLHCCH